MVQKIALQVDKLKDAPAVGTVLVADDAEDVVVAAVEPALAEPVPHVDPARVFYPPDLARVPAGVYCLFPTAHGKARWLGLC